MYDEFSDDGEDYGYPDHDHGASAGAYLSACSNCGRSFNPGTLVGWAHHLRLSFLTDRVQQSKHEVICRKLAAKTKKRGVFDASKKRIQALGLSPAAIAASQQKTDLALAKVPALTEDSVLFGTALMCRLRPKQPSGGRSMSNLFARFVKPARHKTL
jgi:hypothetical protein